MPPPPRDTRRGERVMIMRLFWILDSRFSIGASVLARVRSPGRHFRRGNPLPKWENRSFGRWLRRFRGCGCPRGDLARARGRGGCLLERFGFRGPKNRRRARIQKWWFRADPSRGASCNRRDAPGRSYRRGRRWRASRRDRRFRGRRDFSIRCSSRGAKRSGRWRCGG